MLKGITIDLWNTLIENKHYTAPRLQILSEWLTSLGFNKDVKDIERAYIESIKVNVIDPNMRIERHIPNSERLTMLLKYLHITLENSQKLQILKRLERVMLDDPPQLKPHVTKTLFNIQNRWNLPLILISDTGITPGHILSEMLKSHAIFQYFTATIYSDETGVNKPNSLPFQRALALLKCDAQEVVHIGDLLPTDIKGAKGCGMHTIWFRPSLDIQPMQEDPDFIVDDFSEIEPILEQLMGTQA